MSNQHCNCRPQTYTQPAEPDEGCDKHFEPCEVEGCDGRRAKGEDNSTCGKAEFHCCCGEEVGDESRPSKLIKGVNFFVGAHCRGDAMRERGL